MSDWDNHCVDAYGDFDSFDACHEACLDDESCFQFAFNGEQCFLAYSFHLGEPSEEESGMKWRNGWLKERITHSVDQQGPCDPKFPWT